MRLILQLSTWKLSFPITWWALQMRSKSCLCKNLAATSAPNVNETPRSFSPQPIVSWKDYFYFKLLHNKVEAKLAEWLLLLPVIHSFNSASYVNFAENMQIKKYSNLHSQCYKQLLLVNVTLLNISNLKCYTSYWIAIRQSTLSWSRSKMLLRQI